MLGGRGSRGASELDDLPFHVLLLPLCCRSRKPAAQALAEHAAEVPGGLDMYGRSLQGSAWLAPRLLVREPGPNAKVSGGGTAVGVPLGI